jgi:putative endonuclease
MSRRRYKFYVYIIASPTGTLYTGMTNNLQVRITQHKEKINVGFTKKYSCNKLVYYEEHQCVYNAIEREKEIKDWTRKVKEELIKTINPHRKDLSEYFE